MSVSSGQFSRNLAAVFGEQYNRSVSRRLADGIFGPSSSNGALDAVHVLLTIAALDIKRAPAKTRTARATGWSLVGILGWILGAESRTSHGS